MNNLKRNILSAIAAFAAVFAFAQADSDAPTGTLSPYSQFGVGQLTNPSTGFNAAMEGLSIGMRRNEIVNPQNPASYSAVDSLTFIFDAGAYLQFSHLAQGAKKLNCTTGDFEYVAALFRMTKGMGVSFGLQPLSQVGYDYTEQRDKDGIKTTTTYHARHGGIQKYFAGVGWQAPFKTDRFSLSAGANLSYLHGEITRNVVCSTSESDATSYSKTYNTKISSYGLDAGVQAQVRLNKKDLVTVGATYGLGHNLGADQELTFTTSTEGSALYTAEDAFALPHTYGVGASYSHRNKWTVGFDYSTQLWEKLEYPEFQKERGLTMISGYYKNRQRFVLGGEYCVDPDARNIFDRIRYRGGVSYTTPYYKNGPKELAVSAGFSLPVINGYNNRSVINIAAQWVKADGDGLVKENSFRIKVGLTFTDNWFMKWKLK